MMRMFDNMSENSTVRQAVVVVHGIGEQRPMTTLRGFVKGVIKKNAQTKDLPFYSKPDRLSDTLELRRLTVDKKYTGNNSTDFYELYWQHLMTGTTLAHLQAWLEMLLWRRPHKVPRRLRLLWCLVWAMIFLILLVLLWLFGYFLQLGEPPVVKGIFAVFLTFLVRPLLLPLLRYLVNKIGINYIGDAARYLSPFPENVAVRHAIRSAGLNLLRKLHLDPLRRYDRIVVVGHSLGSVIAYDVLTYLWQEMHSKVERSQVDGSPKLDEIPYSSELLESIDQPALKALLKMMECQKNQNPCDLGKDEQSKLICQYMGNQYDLLQEYNNEYKNYEDSCFPWRITDLVTIGSPLTYADFLLADDIYNFSEKVKQREFPICPPQPEDSRDEKDISGNAGLLERVLGADDQKRSIRILHHAALFACTRWTNLYFPGDIIGGPLACKFGWGIKDVELKGRSAKCWTSHVKYWAEKEYFALRKLIAALRLKE